MFIAVLLTAARNSKQLKHLWTGEWIHSDITMWWNTIQQWKIEKYWHKQQHKKNFKFIMLNQRSLILKHIYICEKEMATHSSIPAWKIPWTEEPGGLQSMESQRIRHDWVTEHVCKHTHTHTHTHTCSHILFMGFMANHLSIPAARIPRTVWKDKKIWYQKISPAQVKRCPKCYRGRVEGY